MSKRRGTDAAHNTDQVVGRNIRTARLAAEMSQEKLGEKLGISFQQIQKYEKGNNRVSAGNLQLLADGLDVDTSWLLQDHSGLAVNKVRGASATRTMFEDKDIVACAKIMHSFQHRSAKLAMISIAEILAKFTKPNGKG